VPAADRPTAPRLTTARIAAAGYTALAVTDTLLAASRSPTRRRFRMVTKPLLMPALGTAFSASLSGREINRGGLLRGGTVAGQALSGAGDIALLGRGDTAFLAGLGSFLGAHVAYSTALASAGRRLSDISQPVGVTAAALAFTALAPVMGRAAGRTSPPLGGPVIAYTAALAAMFATSTRLEPTIPRRARRTVVAGTALFLLSDALLASREFLLKDAPPLVDGAVMATYSLGQGLIAAGVSQAVRSSVTG
jgi:uncharacterized membrane protein YhhN